MCGGLEGWVDKVRGGGLGIRKWDGVRGGV